MFPVLAATHPLAAPTDILFLLLLAVGVAWWAFGTMSIRGCASLTLLITKGARRPAPVDEFRLAKPPILVTPSISTAVGIVLLNALIMGACVLVIYFYRAMMRGLGGDLSPLQTGSLWAIALVIGPAIVVGVNRSALRTNWLCSAAITLGYLLLTATLSAATWILFLIGLGK